MNHRVLSLLVVGACSGAAPTTMVPAPEVGRAERVQLGSLEAYALEDGRFVAPNDGTLFAVGRPPAETGDALAASGLPRDQIRLDLQCLLVKAAGRVILFDAGAGAALPEAGRLPHSLAKLGVAAASVTDIFISHAHTDHVGGLLAKDGTLAFPSATIHMSTAEWTSFQAEAGSDQDARRFVATIGAKVVPFEPGAQVLPMVKAVATPGHTPGHSSYEIGRRELLYLGDVAHHSVLSVQHPTWSLAVDADRPAAEAMRQQLLGRLAAEHTRVFVFHFPYPGVGQIVGDGAALRWKPER